MTLRRDLLQIHLNDHLAAVTALHALAGRCRTSNPGTPLAEALSALEADLRADRAQLERLLTALDLKPNPAKMAAATIGERLGRLKLNGQLRGYSPLSRALELQGLCAGMEVQRSLWTGLREIAPHDPVIAGLPFDELVGRSERWRDDLDRHRLEAVTRAFVR